MTNLSAIYQKDNKLFLCFLVLLIWIPLPLASNRPWAWHLVEIITFCMCIVWVFSYLRTPRPLPRALKKSKWLFTFLGFFAAVIALQLTPLPLFIVEPLRFIDLQLENTQLITLSTDPQITFLHLRKTLAYIGLIFLLLALVNTKKRARQFAMAILISGIFQAIYGGLMTLSGAEYGFFIKKEGGLGVATGTFWNRNHYANYLILCLSMGTGLLLSELYQKRSKNWKERSNRLIDAILGSKLRIRIGLVLMVIALVLSHSRMGNTAFFLSLLAGGILWLYLTKRATRGSILLIISLVIIDTIIVGSWFGIDKVKERLEATVIVEQESTSTTLPTLTHTKLKEKTFSTEPQYQPQEKPSSHRQPPSASSNIEATKQINILPFEQRTGVSEETWHMIQQQWFLGSGAGTNYTIYPKHRKGDNFGYFDHTHNDYLEIIAEHGIIGAFFLSAFVLLAVINTIKTMIMRKSLFFQAMSFAPLMSSMAMLIHSTVDFNLQIPANAITYLLILSYSWVLRYTPSK